MDTLRQIIRLREKILVHSCLYYRLGVSIIPDHQFDRWAMELVKMNEEHPDLVNKGEWWIDFKDFDGTTGFHLPLDNHWVVRKAEQLKEYAERKGLLL